MPVTGNMAVRDSMGVSRSLGLVIYHTVANIDIAVNNGILRMSPKESIQIILIFYGASMIRARDRKNSATQLQDLIFKLAL
ncbi:MAG: hypothetical protein IJO94_04895, partial [Firmicutes bacterium]|nr:hypothetical protein [Bacillota bacterium]